MNQAAAVPTHGVKAEAGRSSCIQLLPLLNATLSEKHTEGATGIGKAEFKMNYAFFFVLPCATSLYHTVPTSGTCININLSPVVRPKRVSVTKYPQTLIKRCLANGTFLPAMKEGYQNIQN